MQHNNVTPHKILTAGLMFVVHPIRVIKINPSAEMPFKDHPDDVGFDLTLISRTEGRVEDEIGAVGMFNTGLQIAPPPGYHLEIVARSSLHKSGYELATGTSIIDPSYRGEIYVPLKKFKEGEDLELPARAVQLILRETNYAHVSVVSDFGDNTLRGDNGFGSTGGYNAKGVKSLGGLAVNKPQPRQRVADDENTPVSAPRGDRRGGRKGNMF
jgi:dUTP pyrophosphatase